MLCTALMAEQQAPLSARHQFLDLGFKRPKSKACISSTKAKRIGKRYPYLCLPCNVRDIIKVTFGIRSLIIYGGRDYAVFNGQCGEGSKWPVIDLVELIASLYACSPNTALIALFSERSLSFVDVPCAFI